jgi:hypothetical protein
VVLNRPSYQNISSPWDILTSVVSALIINEMNKSEATPCFRMSEYFPELGDILMREDNICSEMVEGLTEGVRARPL